MEFQPVRIGCAKFLQLLDEVQHQKNQCVLVVIATHASRECSNHYNRQFRLKLALNAFVKATTWHSLETKRRKKTKIEWTVRYFDD